MIPNRLTRWLRVAGLIGGVLLVFGALISQIEIPSVRSERSFAERVLGLLQPGVERVWGNALVAAFFVVTIGLGGAVFLALTSVTGARWHRGMQNIPKGLIGLLPVGGVAMRVLLFSAVAAIRVASSRQRRPGHVLVQRTLAERRGFLPPGQWLSSSSGCCLPDGWLPGQTRDRPIQTSGIKLRMPALFLVVFSVTLSVASWDWFMALEPLWFSTVFSVYHFSGLVMATLAAIVILGVVSRSRGETRNDFTDDHLHDLGQLLLGFSCFWMYIWYSQYMLIWYTNLPEESIHFAQRTSGAWGAVMALNVVLNFVVPFLVLLPKPNKRSANVMIKVAVVVLIGRWLDLSLMVFPPSIGKTPLFGIWELAAVVAAAGLAVSFLPRPIHHTTTHAGHLVAEQN